MPQIFIGSQLPNFNFNSQLGEDDFYSHVGQKWSIIFSHPADFTPICTTELGELARNGDEFFDRDTKVLGLSTNDVASHQAWIADIKAATGQTVDFPIICDTDLNISVLLGMISQEMRDEVGKDNNNTLLPAIRTVLIVSPDRKLQVSERSVRALMKTRVRATTTTTTTT